MNNYVCNMSREEVFLPKFAQANYLNSVQIKLEKTIFKYIYIALVPTNSLVNDFHTIRLLNYFNH